MHMLTISIGQEDMKTCLVSDQRNDASIASHEGAHVLYAPYASRMAHKLSRSLFLS